MKNTKGLFVQFRMAPEWHLLNRPEAVHGLEQRKCHHSEARDRYIDSFVLPTRMPDFCFFLRPGTKKDCQFFKPEREKMSNFVLKKWRES
jgi:hypothetical protein